MSTDKLMRLFVWILLIRFMWWLQLRCDFVLRPFDGHLTTYQRSNFLHLFAFLVSRPPQSALLRCQAPTLLLNRWLAYLTGSSILVLKLTFSPDPFPRNLPLSLSL